MLNFIAQYESCRRSINSIFTFNAKNTNRMNLFSINVIAHRAMHSSPSNATKNNHCVHLVEVAKKTQKTRE